MKISKGGKKPPAKVFQEKAEEINGPDGEMTIPYRASLHDHAIVPSQQALRLLCAARLFFFKSLFDSLHCHWTNHKSGSHSGQPLLSPLENFFFTFLKSLEI
jgi:hypothetical protein